MSSLLSPGTVVMLVMMERGHCARFRQWRCIGIPVHFFLPWASAASTEDARRGRCDLLEWALVMKIHWLSRGNFPPHSVQKMFVALRIS